MVDLWQFLCYLTSEAPLCWIKSDAFCSLVLKCGTNFDCSSWKYSIYELLYNIHHPCLDGIKLQHQKEKVKTFICILNNHTIFDMCLCLFYTFHIFLHFIQKWMIETHCNAPCTFLLLIFLSFSFQSSNFNYSSSSQVQIIECYQSSCWFAGPQKK